jgi:hypothetical protein
MEPLKIIEKTGKRAISGHLLKFAANELLHLLGQ